ncbi:hypothetical protein V7417_05235 [Bacillus pumilus]|uniref:hypothetical protein n=1 Tax=Bacillus pumilus TaxID=1408 RepID=UPI002FFF0B54
MSNNSELLIANDVIRDPNLSSEEFSVYAVLVRVYFSKKEKVNPIQVNHKRISERLGIPKNETLKKYINGLYEKELILNKVDALPRKGLIDITLNETRLPIKGSGIPFTQVTESVLSSECVAQIKMKGIRLYFYLKSYMDTRHTPSFAYPGMDRISAETGVAKNTIRKHLSLMKNKRFIDIQHSDKQSSKESYYGEDDQVITTGYQNKYFLYDHLIDEYSRKNSVL